MNPPTPHHVTITLESGEVKNLTINAGAVVVDALDEWVYFAPDGNEVCRLSPKLKPQEGHHAGDPNPDTDL